MTRETMIDPRGSEYGVYVATREVERRDAREEMPSIHRPSRPWCCAPALTHAS